MSVTHDDLVKINDRLANLGGDANLILARIKVLVLLTRDKYLKDTEHPEAAEMSLAVLNEYANAIEGFIKYMDKVLSEEGAKIQNVYKDTSTDILDK